MKKKDDREIEGIIWKAVEAMKVASERSVKDAYRATERRLYALPDIRAKLADDRETLSEVKERGVRSRNHSVTRFLKSGVRLTQEEVLSAVVMNLEAEISASEHEIELMEWALAAIADDEYYKTVTGKYFENG